MNDRLPPISSVPLDGLARASMPVVIVTRPRAQAAELIAALERHGLRAHPFPLLEIAPTPDPADLRDALTNPARYALGVFVSPNAVQQAFAAMPESYRWPPDVPVAVVGPASARALAACGVAPPRYRVIQPDANADDACQDSEALYRRLDAPSLRHRDVLIVRGNGGREWLADQLRAAGARVRIAQAYRRSMPTPDAMAWRALRAALAGRHAWTLTSAEAVRHLDDLARANLSPAEIETLRGAPCFALHPRIVLQARQLGFRDVTLTGAGDDALLTEIVAWAAVAPSPLPTESNPSSPAPIVTQTSVPPTAALAGPPDPSSSARAARRGRAWLWIALIALALGVAALQVRNERLASATRQRTQQNERLTQDMRTLLRADQETLGQLQQTFGALEARIAEMRDSQAALESASQDLMRGRADWQRLEIERLLEITAEQLQLTGNVRVAQAALQNIDARLATLDPSRFRAQRSAVARDIARLAALQAVDLSGAAIRLEEAIRGIDALPLQSERADQPARSQAAPEATRGNAAPAMASMHDIARQVRAGWTRAWSGVRDELGALVRVRRVDQTEALLLSPDQAWFLRESLKLQLMHGRLALRARDQAMFHADLGRVDALLARGFDARSPQVAWVRNLLKQARISAGAFDTPTLADSLSAVRGERKE